MSWTGGESWGSLKSLVAIEPYAGRRATEILLQNGADPRASNLLFWALTEKNLDLFERLLAQDPSLHSEQLGQDDSIFENFRKLIGSQEGERLREILWPHLISVHEFSPKISQELKDAYLLAVIYEGEAAWTVETVKRLLTLGANPNAVVRSHYVEERPALFYACNSPFAAQLFDLFQEAKVDVHVLNKDGKNLADYSLNTWVNPRVYLELKNRWPDLKATGSTKPSLWNGIFKGSLTLLEQYLTAGVDPNEILGVEFNGGQSIYLSASGPAIAMLFFDEFDPKFTFKALRMLIAHGANVNARDKDGYTILGIIARECGRLHSSESKIQVGKELARILISHGADPRVGNVDGRSALEVFRSARASRIVGRLPELSFPKYANRADGDHKIGNRCKVHSIEAVLAADLTEAETLRYSRWESCSLR